MTSKAEELIAQPEAEIVKRDARIEALEEDLAEMKGGRECLPTA